MDIQVEEEQLDVAANNAGQKSCVYVNKLRFISSISLKKPMCLPTFNILENS